MSILEDILEADRSALAAHRAALSVAIDSQQAVALIELIEAAGRIGMTVGTTQNADYPLALRYPHHSGTTSQHLVRTIGEAKAFLAGWYAAQNASAPVQA